MVEIRGIHRLQLRPGDRAAHPALGVGADRVRRGDGAVARVLVVVEEDTGPALLLPPLAGGDVREPPLDLPRQRQRRPPHLEEVPPGLDAHIDVHPARAGRLGPAEETNPLEHRLHLRGDAADGAELHPGLRIQVHPQLVRVVHVAPADRPGVEVEAAEVCRPDDMGHVHRTQLARAPAAREGDGDRLQPLGDRRRDTLLVEELTAGAIGIALEDGGTLTHPAQSARPHGQVVADQVQLGLTSCREEHLVGVRDPNRSSVDLELGVQSRHGFPRQV